MSRDEPSTHLFPRTAEGRKITLVWVVLFLICMPPITHTLLDRPDVWIAGVPFLFLALFVIYTALIGVLVWALRRGI